jgi:hypothetical protein
MMKREQLRALNIRTETGFDRKKFQALVTFYPRGLGTTRGFSSSMEFGMNVLRKVSGGAELQLDDGIFINDLVRLLLRRALEKKIE